ncbi:beta-glucan synthesis-associated [Pisolithus sp. B1]|nr:beta-glucan synthesis-associated [Pisolithus sp. B1]
MAESSETSESSNSSRLLSSRNDPSPLPASVSETDSPSVDALSSPAPSDRPEDPLQPFLVQRTLSPSSVTDSSHPADSYSPRPGPSRPPASAGAFVSSPLNPNATGPSHLRSRPHSTQAISFPRVASEDSQVLGSQFLSPQGQRGSMILYRLSIPGDRTEPPAMSTALYPPRPIPPVRNSTLSASGDSILSLSADSKYPYGPSRHGALVPYAYDPDLDNNPNEPDIDDFLHDPEDLHATKTSPINSRGLLNVGSLAFLIIGLLCLFVFFPVFRYFEDKSINAAIVGNVLVNSTGQVPVPESLYTMPHVIDPSTPVDALTRIGFDNFTYDLVFSDEFNKPGRTFWPGDDPYWEAANLWYWTTDDQEWYDPGQISTKEGGYLSIVLDQAEDKGMSYKSGMLQSWNKFCFTRGYIEVSVTLPGPNEESNGYWPAAWTLGNLARPGYGASTDGVWPYSYDSCDVGTFPNQTYVNGSGPAAALLSQASQSKYNYALSWLPGQRLSSCTCPNEDHPGPSPTVGRGAPEIDILEVEHNKLGGTGQMVSQSAQFAPFTHDYLFGNGSTEMWEVLGNETVPNAYHGSAVQQAVSALTELPPDVYVGSGNQFITFGFEYWSNPKNSSDGYVIWQTGGQPTARLGAPALSPDLGLNGTQVGQRLISLEPMSIVLNLGMSPNWQTIDTSTLSFPAEMRVDYVRVYQRQGETNIGCSPPDFPTDSYIKRHLDSYMNPNLTQWNYPQPKNGLYAGGC